MQSTEIFQKYPPLEEIVTTIRAEIYKCARPAEEVIVTDEEFQKMLGICRRTAIRIRQSGSLRYSKVGGIIIYMLSDILVFVQSHSVESFNKKNAFCAVKN
jgi:hypothetical protein